MGAGLTGYQHDGGGGSVGLGEAPQALAQLVVSGVLGRGVDVCDRNLLKPITQGFRGAIFNGGQSSRYLAVVKLLDHSFALLADVADANEFGLPVTPKEAAAYSLDHNGGGASARHAAVLDVPEDANRRNVFRTVVLWRPWWRRRTC